MSHKQICNIILMVFEDVGITNIKQEDVRNLYKLLLVGKSGNSCKIKNGTVSIKRYSRQDIKENTEYTYYNINGSDCFLQII